MNSKLRILLHLITLLEIGDDYLPKRYSYLFGDVTHVEGDIQRYFNTKIADTIDTLYREFCVIYITDLVDHQS